MSLSWIRYIPFINSLYSFSIKDHLKAIPKFLILWLLSSLPILWSTLFSSVPEGDYSKFAKFWNSFCNSFSVSELFVYSASFLSPLLYIIFEKFQTVDTEKSAGQKISETFRRVFNGYRTVFFIAILVLLLTASAYSIARTKGAQYESTFMFQLVPNLAAYVYLFAIFCWYLSILDGIGEGGDFVAINRAGEEDITKRFKRRVNNKRTK
jgi:hypothetical protein